MAYMTEDLIYKGAFYLPKILLRLIHTNNYSNRYYWPRIVDSFFKLGFTPCKAEQPLQHMELQEKEVHKANRKSTKKEPTVKRCLLILDLKPLRS